LFDGFSFDAFFSASPSSKHAESRQPKCNYQRIVVTWLRGGLPIRRPQGTQDARSAHLVEIPFTGAGTIVMPSCACFKEAPGPQASGGQGPIHSSRGAKVVQHRVHAADVVRVAVRNDDRIQPEIHRQRARGKASHHFGVGFLGAGAYFARRRWWLAFPPLPSATWISRLGCGRHPHGYSDHIGGMHAVLNNFSPARAVDRPCRRSLRIQALLEQANNLGITIVRRSEGDLYEMGRKTRVTVFPAASDGQTATQPRNNDRCIALRCRDSACLLEAMQRKTVERKTVEQRVRSYHPRAGSSQGRAQRKPDLDDPRVPRPAPRWAIISVC